MRVFDEDKVPEPGRSRRLRRAASSCGRPRCLCPPASAQQRTIVIDPGHGGLDVGAKGKFGAVEKDVTLAISLKLKALIERTWPTGSS